MNMAERWLARKTPPKSWAELARRSQGWGRLEAALAPIILDMLESTNVPMVPMEEPIELRAERVRAKIYSARKTLIGFPSPPKGL